MRGKGRKDCHFVGAVAVRSREVRVRWPSRVGIGVGVRVKGRTKARVRVRVRDWDWGRGFSRKGLDEDQVDQRRNERIRTIKDDQGRSRTMDQGRSGPKRRSEGERWDLLDLDLDVDLNRKS